MQSIDDKILSNVKKRGRGTIFFAQDMAQYGQRQSVLKALERMAAAGTIIRLARGIYCYPKIDKELGLGILYPSLDDIAQAVAKRDRAADEILNVPFSESSISTKWRTLRLRDSQAKNAQMRRPIARPSRRQTRTTCQSHCSEQHFPKTEINQSIFFLYYMSV